MSKYLTGKIYQIISEETNKVYIGSTINTLSVRMSQHISAYKRWKNGNRNFCASFIILQYSNFAITLVEDYPCLSLQQLDAREKYYINLDKNSINFRTKIGKHENKQFMQNLKQ